ncbi:hypothetical protein EDB85DRAFT_743032 [Lactarius pseudohatsudake]|nr:hypothetical protein EDB85DRAFT_743032 [Lactarius pseudohatsudake]
MTLGKMSRGGSRGRPTLTALTPWGTYCTAPWFPNLKSGIFGARYPVLSMCSCHACRGLWTVGRLSLYLYTIRQRGMVDADAISGPPGFYIDLGEQFRFADKVVAAAPTWINGSRPGEGGVKDTACTWRRSTPAHGLCGNKYTVTTKFAFAKRERKESFPFFRCWFARELRAPELIPYRSAAQHAPHEYQRSATPRVTRHTDIPRVVHPAPHITRSDMTRTQGSSDLSLSLSSRSP